MNGKAFWAIFLAAALSVGAALAVDAPPKADNTAANSSDSNSASVTPVDQSNSSDAIRVTAAIRRAVIADKSLSSSAHNVKIVTTGNTVTLRGPVDSAADKDRIDSLARQIAAGKDVHNELTIKGD